MGRVLLVTRLASRDLRHRPAQGALLLLVMMAATTALTLGLARQPVPDPVAVHQQAGRCAGAQ